MIERLNSLRLRWISTLVLLLGSGVVSHLVIQDEDDEEPQINCIEIGPFGSHIRASLDNRISQLQTELELTEAQAKRLRVVANGVIKREASPRSGTFHFGNPLLSKFWQSNLQKVLTEKQLEQLVEFDQTAARNRKSAKSEYGKTPNVADSKASFVATNLQFHLSMTNQQTRIVQGLLKSHLEEIGDENWDPKLTPFYEANQDRLQEVLLESQRLFFDGNSLINGIGDQSVWDRDWRKATCTDCHA